jgi:hypothetical protein
MLRSHVRGAAGCRMTAESDLLIGGTNSDSAPLRSRHLLAQAHYDNIAVGNNVVTINSG